MMVVNILTCIFEALLITMVFNAYGTGDSSRRTWRFDALNVVFLSCIIALSNAIVSMSFLNLILIGCGIALSGYMYTKNIVKSLVMSVLLVFLFSMSEIVTLFIITTVMKINIVQAVSDENYRLMGIIVSKMLTFAILKVVCYRRNNLAYEFKSSYWLLFFAVILTSTVAINLMFLLRYNSGVDKYSNIVVLSTMGLLYITFLVMYLFERMSVQSNALIEREKLELKLNHEICNKKKQLEEKNNLMRFRHDYKNYEMALRAFLDKGDIENAEICINELSDMVELYGKEADVDIVREISDELKRQ